MNSNPNFTNSSWKSFNWLLAAGAGRLRLLPWLLCVALTLGTVASAQSYRVIKSFGVLTNATGTDPAAPLVQGPDGALYGTTYTSDGPVVGAVFKLNTDGTGFTVLKRFTNSLEGKSLEGAGPTGGLVLSGSALYGTTAGGGSSNSGVVFKVNTDGSGYAVLKSFTGSDGNNPNGGLVLADSTLYGTTYNGGSSNCGVVFRVNTDGTGFTVLKRFTNSLEGAWPMGGLVLLGSTLYGTTSGGGSSGDGVVFQVNTDGSGYAVLRSFAGSDGNNPNGGLVLAGNTLYGTTYSGGSSNCGAVFKVNTDGSGYAVLKTFTGGDGNQASGALLLAGSTLYGTTSEGGSSGCGAFFKVNTDGSGFAVLKSFNFSDGMYPQGGLVLGSSTLYGTTSGGGSSNGGVVFKVNTDGSGYVVLRTFTASDGGWPHAGLVLDGSTLYGTTFYGGSADCGTVFRVNTDGSGYLVLKRFTGSDGANPIAGLVLAGSTLYGTTMNGGSAYIGGGSGYGVVFKVNTDGSGFAVLRSFIGSDGEILQAGLLLAGSTLYGTAAYGGSSYGSGYSGLGVVFKMNTDGSGFALLKSFNGSDGACPQANLVLSGSTLYGTTTGGGSLNWGTVFKVNTDGSGFAVLKSFPGYPTSDGSQPFAGLVLEGGTLYGTTSHGGGSNSNAGIVFKVNTDGSGYTVLKCFTGGDGQTPQGDLVLSGNRLYGTTYYGGTMWYSNYWGCGTVFKMNTDGSGYAVLKSFTGSNGQNPDAGLVLAGNTLYGTTEYGGDFNEGLVFSVACLSIITPPLTQTAETGATVGFRVEAASLLPGLAYQWFFGGTNALVGATNAFLELTNVQPVQAGAYTVVVTNMGLAVTSAPVTLNVIPPVDHRLVPGINLMAQAGYFLGLDYRDNLDPTGNWETMATMTLSTASQFYFDLSAPLPPQRFYRAWQTGTPSVVPSLSLPGMVPAITLTGSIGHSVRLDYINQFGPTDAWVTLATVPLTNTSQLYFDTSSIGQPARLWRIVPVP